MSETTIQELTKKTYALRLIISMCVHCLWTKRRSGLSATVIRLRKPYICPCCGNELNAFEEKKAEVPASFDDEAFYKQFDLLEPSKITLRRLKAENNLLEWLMNFTKPKEYHLAFVGELNSALVDLTRMTCKELTKSLFERLSKESEVYSSKFLYIAVLKNSPQYVGIVRDLIVYGFEKVQAQFTTNTEISIFKLSLENDAECEF